MRREVLNAVVREGDPRRRIKQAINALLQVDWDGQTARLLTETITLDVTSCRDYVQLYCSDGSGITGSLTLASDPFGRLIEWRAEPIEPTTPVWNDERAISQWTIEPYCAL